MRTQPSVQSSLRKWSIDTGAQKIRKKQTSKLFSFVYTEVMKVRSELHEKWDCIVMNTFIINQTDYWNLLLFWIPEARFSTFLILYLKLSIILIQDAVEPYHILDTVWRNCQSYSFLLYLGKLFKRQQFTNILQLNFCEDIFANAFISFLFKPKIR